MDEDKKMFQIGSWAVVLVFFIAIGLQVGYRTQGRALDDVRNKIVKTQQQIAVAQANFASFVRPEVLRNSVITVAPKSESVGFNKFVKINELPDRKSEE